ncbi:hypothetical protein GCM10010112_42990 [Actinoplanes lobatus]|uniref:Lcl C-terminal domain-containing protein n=1 Tax=Actinoplanes lobatus TaxID=113568 RepID=A0A7W7HBX0_9ACTN|nr:DUF1566 domain-containing protein [Actinoplanes lobatus]MBB4747659.1 hypothetical protein [Actinoplanes lobatus]GGN73571.1 hypothetical protein GCM10010112_42990 [Actinoplanes lobatus]GIE39777.1 hypothetical protein Alo02nite_26750 [Actinoplanes lobatus]
MSTSDDSGSAEELRQVERAVRWLDEADRDVFALWWEEARGRIGRGQVADRLETSRADADVRIQRMRTSLEWCRVLVAALEASPQCRGLAVPVSAWDGTPDLQWRERFGGHIRECRTCRGRLRGEKSIERLLAGAVTEPAEPTEPVKPTKPAEPAKPAEPDETPAPAARKPRRGRRTLVAGLAAIVLVGAGAAAYTLLPKRPGPIAEAADVAAGASTAPSASTESTSLPVIDAPGSYTFAAAKAYCATLGRTLPTRIESLSIAAPGPFFWTSTPYATTGTARKAWAVSGSISRGAAQSARHHARCTRPATPTVTDLRIAAGQVTDPVTGLTWQRGFAPAAMAASAATSYCAKLTLGGRSWRLPTVRELATTVDETRTVPAVDTTTFPGTPRSGWFWAAPESGKRWMLTYLDGSTDSGRARTGHVRCVS